MKPNNPSHRPPAIETSNNMPEVTPLPPEESKEKQPPILQTNLTKKIVFIFAFIASSFFNITLFGSIGYYFHTKIIFATIGLATVYFQTLELRNFYNIKKSRKYFHLAMYIMCTLISMSGTIGLGVSQIEKSKPSVDQIDANISINAINRTLTESKIIEPWAVNLLLKKKSRLQENKIKVKETEKDISSSITGLANTFKISNELMTFIILMSIAFILEFMIFGSATFPGRLFTFPTFKRKVVKIKVKKEKLSKIEKEVVRGQGIFDLSDYRKVG